LRAAGVADAVIEERGPVGLVCRVPIEDAHAALEALRDREGFTFPVTLFGVDTGEGVEIVYHLRSPESDSDVLLKAPVPYGGSLPSAHEVFTAWMFPEREAAEMFGLKLEGHPNPKRLLTSDDGSLPPLLKSTPVRTHDEVLDRSPVTRETYVPGAPWYARKGEGAAAQAGRRSDMLGVPSAPTSAFRRAPSLDRLTTDHLVVNMGPQHPSTHGVLHVLLELDGEEVVAAEVSLGYLHRGIEKLAENRRYAAIPSLLDRADYLSGVHTGLAMSLAVEELMEVEVPDKANWLRSLVSEITRVASHLIFYGTFGLDAGGMGQFLYAIREREMLLDVLETLTGQRMMFNYVRPGGVAYDMHPDAELRLREFLDVIDGRIDEYHELLTGNEIFQRRVKGIGVIDLSMANRYGLTGPTLRAAGMAWDLRRERPYAAYTEVDVQVPTGQTGDCWDRYIVRMEELRIAVGLIRTLLDGIPEGSHIATMPKVLRVPAGEAYGAVESPRGEVGVHLTADGTDKPARLHLRAPTYYSVAVIEELLPGLMIADTVMAMGSLDIVMGEIDR
jgi:NADH-quinone oxidoreductase subunit D